jgi:phage FluMu gp28-like protein
VFFISTHDGVENAFNELLEETRKGTLKHKPAILTITFEDALRDGLYQRICLTKGERWTEDGERAWAQEIRDFYGDDATEELDCIPKASGGRYLARTLLEARAVRVPVVRWALRPEFVDQPEEARIRTVETFCRDQLAPLVAALPADSRSFLGTDFARSGDVSVDWPLVLLPDLRRHTPFVVELRNVPFTSQWQIVKWLGEHLPRFSGAAFDATGNGAYLAEQARQHWGSECVDEVKVSRGWYLENMPPMKSALEESLLDIPADADVVDDFRAIEVIDGVPRIPDHARAKTSTGQRHGDTAFAACLAYSASRKLDAGPLIFAAEGELRSSAAFNDDAGPGHGLTGWLQ